MQQLVFARWRAEFPPEQPFEVPAGDGVLAGHRGGDGPPALVLHGGPGVPDYTEGLAAELGGFLSTIRYTQRGALPSTVGAPYTIESHAADALAVLDRLGIERAWAVGHSWGGHLALHLAVSEPERLLGVIAVDPLGAYGGEMFEEVGENLRRSMTPGRARARRRGRRAPPERRGDRTTTSWSGAR